MIAPELATERLKAQIPPWSGRANVITVAAVALLDLFERLG